MGVWENPLFSPFSSDPLSSCWKIAGFSLSSERNVREGVGSSGTNIHPPFQLPPCSDPLLFPLLPCPGGAVLFSSNALNFFPYPLYDERVPLEDAGPMTCLKDVEFFLCCGSPLWRHKWYRKPEKCRGERRQLNWKWLAPLPPAVTSCERSFKLLWKRNLHV